MPHCRALTCAATKHSSGRPFPHCATKGSIQRHRARPIRPFGVGPKPAMARSSVDFPEPDGPKKAKNSPGRISRSTPFKTLVLPKDKWTFSIFMPAFAMVFAPLVSITGFFKFLVALNNDLACDGANGDHDHGDDTQRRPSATSRRSLHEEVNAIGKRRVIVAGDQHNRC